MGSIDQAVDKKTVEGREVSGEYLPAFRHIGPNWYSAVMGVSIIPSAGIMLFPEALRIWQGLWIITAVAFTLLLIARAIHFTWHWDQAKAHFLDPALAPFYACVSIAFLAVGLITYTVGKSLIGEDLAFAINAVMFSIGTTIGLVVAVGVVILMIVSHDLRFIGMSPVWFLPAMGPMVSAAFAAPILVHMGSGEARQLLTLCLYGMIGLDFAATMIVFPMVLQRLFLHGPLPIQVTPALFLGLAPFGQGVSALSNLADTIPGSGLASPYADGFVAMALLIGVPVMGFTLLWLAASLVMVIRAFAEGMKFSMVWWSFGFPLGTVVTGMAGITRHSGLSAFHWFTVAVYALLCLLVGITLLGTIRGLLNGDLLKAPAKTLVPPLQLTEI